MSNELRGEHRPPFSSFRLSHPSFFCLWTRGFEIIRMRVKRGGVFFVLLPCMVLLFPPLFTYGHHESIPPFSSPFLPFSYQNHCCRTGLRRGWDGPGEREREARRSHERVAKNPFLYCDIRCPKKGVYDCTYMCTCIYVRPDSSKLAEFELTPYGSEFRFQQRNPKRDQEMISISQNYKEEEVLAWPGSVRKCSKWRKTN